MRSLLVRVLVPRIVLFGVVTTTLGLARLLSVDTSPPSALERLPLVMPSWTVTDQRAHPGCVPSVAWPEGSPAGSLVTYSFRDHRRRKVSFAEAWRRNHDRTEVDDVWVLGVCPAHGTDRTTAPLRRKAHGRSGEGAPPSVSAGQHEASPPGDHERTTGEMQ